MIDFSFRFAKLLHFFDITKFFSIKKHKKGNFLEKIMFFSIFFKIDTCFCTFWHAIWNVISAFEYVNLCYYNIIIFSVFLLWFGSPGGGPSYFLSEETKEEKSKIYLPAFGAIALPVEQEWLKKRNVIDLCGKTDKEAGECHNGIFW